MVESYVVTSRELFGIAFRSFAVGMMAGAGVLAVMLKLIK